MPGILMSSTYVAVPVINRGSSRRRIRLPTSVSCLVRVVAMGLRSSCFRRGFHGVDDMLIAGTAADVTLQALPDFCLSRVGIPIENLFRRDDHPRRAETALQS